MIHFFELNVLLQFVFLPFVAECHKERRALQKSHEKPQIDKWMAKILSKEALKQESTLANLITTVINVYLENCVPIILYDDHVKNESFLLDQILQKLNMSALHGEIAQNMEIRQKEITNPQPNSCISFVAILQDVMTTGDVMKLKTSNRIIVITKSSQWRVNEFLYSEISRSFVNLLVISPSSQNDEDHETYILYTHKLYVDGLGSSEPMILTSWRNGAFTRPEVDLFPPKLFKGFSGHRFITSLISQPPFVIKNGYDENDDIIWDGLEIRLLELLSELYNFTTDFKQVTTDLTKSPAESVIETIEENKATIGMSGIYLTTERLQNLDVTYPHTQDCAVFASLTSTALPRYRAIMGPFHWSVWLALTSAYLLVMIPLAFADKHTLMHLIKNPEEIENMFWYVFGTFTNCFTFGKENWTKSDKLTPRLLIGFYWIFTTIVTACYTGSIIAFITLPIYPVTVDTVQQLLADKYQIGTLDKGGWQYWFQNSSDPYTEKLFKKIEYLPDIESGLKNTTKAFFWPYAFLGSRAQLDFIIRTKFTTTGKRQLFHISTDCFVPFGVSIIFEKNSEYKDIIDKGIASIVQSGFMTKFKQDIEWNMMRSSTGKLLQANTGNNLRNLVVEDRSLTLNDMQGVFLLLGAGFLMGVALLISETFCGCFNCCKMKNLSSLTLKNNTNLREKIKSLRLETFPLNLVEKPDKITNSIPNFEKDVFGGEFVGNNELREEIDSSPRVD